MKRRQGHFLRGASAREATSISAWQATMRALFIALAVSAVLGAGLVYTMARRGLSTHAEPSRLEEVVARAMRRLATPSAARARSNPVTPTDAVLEDALTHYADHCAICHANDGSGDTQIGRNVYPKAPDMRLARTQSLSDGELFSIIEHGVRLTGMPGWSTGTPEGERESWGLVHFIRRLPQLSHVDIERMETLNPKNPAQFREEEEIRRFLAGEDRTESRAPEPARHRDPQ